MVQFTADEQDILEDETITYETIIIDGEDPPAAPAASDQRGLRGPVSLARRRVYREPPAHRRRKVWRRATRYALNKAGWTIASRQDGSPQAASDVDAGEIVSYASAFQAVSALRRTSKTQAASLMLVRTTVTPGRQP